MQALFCHNTFYTKVEIEWVKDEIFHYEETVFGANANATEKMEKFTEKKLGKSDEADLMVYMVRDTNMTRANQN